jgi:hypothetical protein
MKILLPAACVLTPVLGALSPPLEFVARVGRWALGGARPDGVRAPKAACHLETLRLVNEPEQITRR